MKLVLRIFVGFVLLFVLFIGLVFLFLDSIVVKAVEESGTYALGVETTLEGADIGPLP